MKSLLFTLFGIIALFTPSLSFDCKNEKMNELCLSPAVDCCYTCVKNVVRHDEVVDHKLSICVPVFHNQLGALDNYPSKEWNCTLFRHNPSSDNDHSHPVDPLPPVVDDEEQFDNDVEDEIDTIDDVVDMIFDSINHNIKSENYETEGILFPACFGPICLKQGWQFHKTEFGKDWCGLGNCYVVNKKYYCTYPTNCGNSKKGDIHVYNVNDYHDFETLGGCGAEKFKCMLKKSCRNLVKQLENCDEDALCIYGVVTGTENESFINLVKCMFPK
jgi:hypothetical protein